MTTFTAYVVAVEIHDEIKELAAKVSVFDDGAAQIEIKTLVNAASWQPLALCISEVLKSMHLEGDTP